MDGGRFGEIKNDGEEENYERKIIENIFRNKVIKESHMTGRIGSELTKENLSQLPELYKEIIKKKGQINLPVIPDEAEIWIREIYSDKLSEKRLRAYLSKKLEEIKDRDERLKAKIYLAKFHRKVIHTAASIKDEILAINREMEKLDERALERIKEIKDKKEKENTLSKVIDYTKRIVRYVVQVLIPSGGIKILENIYNSIKEMDFVQKAIIAFTVFALEELLVNYYVERKRKKKLDQLYSEYDKREQELKERARKIMNSMIQSAVRDLEDIAREIYIKKEC